MIPGARLVLLGRQGSGKGTQCVRLSRHFVVPHISTGDMLRAAVREGTELGKMAKTIIDKGGLVGDDIMVGLVSERLSEDDARVRGYILDGFPRTVSQAESLDQATSSRPLDLAIDLVVPRELVLARLSIRRVCRDCGTNYQATDHETSQWSCDNCGGDVVQRDDDTPDAINRRLDLYESQTEPLIDFYGESGRLAQVDGVGSPEEVFGRLTAEVEQRR
ncbi:MAG: adenylate kinase [Actinobacteria bacterium]|nr:adenylate kinase [Actinomycetota bacterium]